jgi:hypothetical protein
MSRAKSDLATMTNATETETMTKEDQHLEPSAGVVVAAGDIEALVDVGVIAQSLLRTKAMMTIRDTRSIEAGVTFTTMKSLHGPRTRIRMKNILTETVPHRQLNPKDQATAAVEIETRTSGGIEKRTKMTIAKSPTTGPPSGIETTTATADGKRTEIVVTRSAKKKIAKIDIGIGTDAIATVTEKKKRTRIGKVAETGTENGTAIEVRDIAADANQLMLETRSLSLVLAVTTRKSKSALRIAPSTLERTPTRSSERPEIASVCSKKRNVSLVWRVGNVTGAMTATMQGRAKAVGPARQRLLLHHVEAKLSMAVTRRRECEDSRQKGRVIDGVRNSNGPPRNVSPSR